MTDNIQFPDIIYDGSAFPKSCYACGAPAEKGCLFYPFDQISMRAEIGTARCVAFSLCSDCYANEDVFDDVRERIRDIVNRIMAPARN